MDIKTLKEHLQLPIIASPMFLVSGVDMVLECCKNNIVGSFPSVNKRTTEGFEAWLFEIERGLKEYNANSSKAAAPFAVNLVVHKTNPRWKADLKICVKHKVPIVITSLGAAPEVVRAVQDYGGLVFHDVTTVYHARKAAAVGVDGIIAVSGGAGGHSGAINPFALVGEIRKVFDGAIILGGSLSTGRDVASALQLGADFAYMGTRFINVQESMANPEYKKMIIDCDSSDIIFTPSITGVPANFLKPSLKEAGFDMDKLMNPASINYGEKLKPSKEGAKTWIDTWSAGHGCGVIDDIPTVERLVNRLKREFKEAVEEQIDRTKGFML